MKKEKEREKEKERKKENKPIYTNRITTLPYSTFERVSIVFYYANLY